MHLVKQIHEKREGYTWIGMALKLFSGVGHLLQVEDELRMNTV